MKQLHLLQKKLMFLQHGDARPHNNAATSALDLKLYHTLPAAWISHCLACDSLQLL
jgi:hypothetical protein